MDALQSLQDWYSRQCDGEWEHTYGVYVETLDNPGWSLRVDLTGTGLENRSFDHVSRTGPESWIDCKVEDAQFRGYGGAGNLAELIAVFLKWAEP